jgi:uncharacterized protein YgiB involved in biofilm formation
LRGVLFLPPPLHNPTWNPSSIFVNFGCGRPSVRPSLYQQSANTKSASGFKKEHSRKNWKTALQSPIRSSVEPTLGACVRQFFFVALEIVLYNVDGIV